jgi:hypothetical protein
MDRRTVWLRCRGVPLHAWDEPLFRSIADSFGSFIELDTSTANRSKLDIARVKISSSKMEFIDKVLNITVMEKKYQIWVVEEGDWEDELGDRGGRCVDEWASTASSVASAAEREAMVIGEDLSDGGGDDGDGAYVGAEGIDLDGEGRKRQFDDTRNGLDKSTKVSENFMGQLGNTQVVGDQVDAVAISIRETCDGFQSQHALGGLLDNGPDGDKWQRHDIIQEVLGVGNVVDPIVTFNSNLELEGDTAGCNENELGPISVGPNSFRPLSALNPDEDVGEANIRGADLGHVEPGLVNAVQQRGIYNEGVRGLVVQVQPSVLVSKHCEGGVNVVEQQVSKSKSDSGNFIVDGCKTKKKVKKGQSVLPGMPKCLQFVDAVQGGKRGGRRRRRKKDGNQHKGEAEPSEDSISNSNSSCHSSSKSERSGGGELLPQAGVGGSDESSSNGGEANRKLLEARKIVDI